MIHAFAPWIKEAASRLDTLGVPRRRLEDLGWTDFHADPPPAAGSLLEFVGTAIELCCFDEEGRWCRDEKILYAMISATEALSSIHVPDEELANLYELALQGDAKMDAIRFWLQVHFGPNATT